MTMLVTLAQARTHLRIDNTDDDLEVTLLVQAASGAVLNYIRNGADDFLDSSGDVIEDSSGPVGIPYEVMAATLLMTGYLYRNRDAAKEDDSDHGFLPRPVIALLLPHRDPSLG